jgi:AraC-like DNA-binding protein
MMKQPCLSEPEVLLEQFIPDHVFLYVTAGTIYGYDGSKTYTLQQGEYCLVRKNRLARYNSEKGTAFHRVFFCFEEAFIRAFQEKYQLKPTTFTTNDTFLQIIPNEMIPAFIQSLQPYTDSNGRLLPAFEDVKYEELMIILLRIQPELAGLFFDYATPAKINLEEFMQRNYKFNVTTERFAYLTGRSLSAFKRDFKAIFNETPNHWLIKRRLQEAYVLIEQEHKKASEIYIDLGFEDLSHFSLAFKKLFGLRPTELAKKA